MPIDSDPDGPDRARETPAAPDGQRNPDAEPPGKGETRDGPQTADFRQRQLAEHARYQRVVKAADQAHEARQAWAEAAPKLQEAWERHKERYPERVHASPSTHPDGAWTAEGDRRLTPEQNAEATKACADLRDEADQHILPAMRRVEAGSPDGKLAGLKNMLKGEDRLKEKIADILFVEPRLAAREAVDKVPDAVRFTLTYGAERYTDGVSAAVESIKAEGLELIKLKNLWTADQYKGINSQWRMPGTRTRLEMQFHTPESLEAKELTHEAYERLRRPETETSQSERDDLEDFQRRTNELLHIPPRVDTIKDFPEKKR